MTLTERFLRAKHWQLFLLTFGIPMVFQFFVIFTMITNFSDGGTPDEFLMIRFFSFFGTIMIIFAATIFGWNWSVAVGLQSKVPASVKMKVRKYKIFFFIPLTYILLICIGLTIAFTGLFEAPQNSEQPDAMLMAGSMMIIFPLHIFSIFCMFYSMYFVAKTIKTVELQRETTFSDFAGEFFMIWFFPIGIWFLQPKINTMVDMKSDVNGMMDTKNYLSGEV